MLFLSAGTKKKKRNYNKKKKKKKSNFIYTFIDAGACINNYIDAYGKLHDDQTSFCKLMCMWPEEYGKQAAVWQVEFLVRRRLRAEIMHEVHLKLLGKFQA